jgi:hypothetical protein
MFKSVMPNMNDILKQNPALVQNMVDAVKNTTPRSAEPSTSDDRYEMKGPGVDISSLMGNIMMPPAPPMSTTAPEAIPNVDQDDDDDDAISDIVEASEGVDEDESDVKEVKVSAGAKGKRGRKKKSVEINL